MSTHLGKAIRLKRCYRTTLTHSGRFFTHQWKPQRNLSSVRIGCASGFWGDTPTAGHSSSSVSPCNIRNGRGRGLTLTITEEVNEKLEAFKQSLLTMDNALPQLLYGTKLDFIILDYLSEITMSLLANARMKMPEMGYTPDFVHFAIGPFLKDIKAKGVRIVSNAGGINPLACAHALKKEVEKAGVQLKIAAITGDDVMDKKEDLLRSGQIFEMHSKKPLPVTTTTMNAYLGAGAIGVALDMGADVVVTGRCTDSALCLGPLIHSFKWKRNDWDKLAAGSLAGHLIECGAQVTGGIFTDWHKVENWDRVGFPVAECFPDGSLVLSKASGTGGLVSPGCVAEQLVYEIHDPRNYVLPDVTCDFSNVTLKQLQEGVAVGGAKGKPCPSHYKVSGSYAVGHRTIAVAVIVGPKAKEKGRRVADAILTRCRTLFKKFQLEDFIKTEVHCLGTEDAYGPNANRSATDSREIVMWLGVQHSSKMALEIFARELASAGTGMAPGLTTSIGGRPKPSPVLKLFSFLYPKDQIKVMIHGLGAPLIYEEPKFEEQEKYEMKEEGEESISKDQSELRKGNKTYRLEELAFTRSGDKGDICNIVGTEKDSPKIREKFKQPNPKSVISRNPVYYPYLKHLLTEQQVKQYFQHLLQANSEVKRYELPGICGLNFVLEGSLGGGGVDSLRPDPQGKAYGQMLLDFQLSNMPDLETLFH